MFCLQKQAQNQLDLFHWALYQLFNLWDKPINQNKQKLKDAAIFGGKTLETMLFSRWMVVFFSLCYPIIALLLGIFKDKTYFALIQKPWLELFFANPKHLKLLNQVPFYSAKIPISFALYYYTCMCHIALNQDEFVDIDNKHIFYQFCRKHSIPTIKCILNKDQLSEFNTNNNNESTEFIIKPCEGNCGTGIFLTKDPQKYLSQIPNVVIQPRVWNHESITKITKNENTLNTFRITTYTKETKLKPVVTFIFVTDPRKVVSNVNANYKETGQEFIYDVSTKTFSKGIHGNFPILIPSINKSDQFSWKIPGLNTFIEYLCSLHDKYFQNFVGIGWDATKISNGDWLIIESNVWGGYYYSNKAYAKKLYQWQLKRINQLIMESKQ